MKAPEVGDRVQFVGYNPRIHETVGIVVNVAENQIAEVLWGDRLGHLHVSQLEVY